jgi:hypothetical protein
MYSIVERMKVVRQGCGHIATMDNFFTSIPLFMDLLDRGTIAISTLRANRKYVPKALFA